MNICRATAVVAITIRKQSGEAHTHRHQTQLERTCAAAVAADWVSQRCMMKIACANAVGLCWAGTKKKEEKSEEVRE
jgi:hypothetical protein